MSKISILEEELTTLDDAITKRLKLLSEKLAARHSIDELQKEAAKMRQLLEERSNKVDLLNKARAEEL